MRWYPLGLSSAWLERELFTCLVAHMVSNLWDRVIEHLLDQLLVGIAGLADVLFLPQ